MKIKVVVLLCIIILTGCTVDYESMIQSVTSASNTEVVTQIDTNKRYYKDIQVEVTDVIHSSRKSGSVRRKYTSITVYSEEYDLTFSTTYFGTGDIYNMNVGDVVWAELYSWKNEVTGEINRREINQIYRDQTNRR